MPSLFGEIEAAIPKTSSNAFAHMGVFHKAKPDRKVEDWVTSKSTGTISLFGEVVIVGVCNLEIFVKYFLGIDKVMAEMLFVENRGSLEVLPDYAVSGFPEITTNFFLFRRLWFGAYKLLSVFLDVYHFFSQLVIWYVRIAQKNHYWWERTSRFWWYFKNGNYHALPQETIEIYPGFWMSCTR